MTRKEKLQEFLRQLRELFEDANNETITPTEMETTEPTALEMTLALRERAQSYLDRNDFFTRIIRKMGKNVTKNK